MEIEFNQAQMILSTMLIKRNHSPKNLWISKPSGVSCLANTSMCWEGEAPIPLGKGTEALYLGPSQTSLSLHSAGLNL